VLHSLQTKKTLGGESLFRLCLTVAAGINDTGGKLPPVSATPAANFSTNFAIVSLTPVANLQEIGFFAIFLSTDSSKGTEILQILFFKAMPVTVL
jgi:hypothetical protein